MKDDIRCVNGRLMRHSPKYDDPDLEIDCGPCPECVSEKSDNLRTPPDRHSIIGIKAELRQSLEDFHNSQTPVGMLCVSPSDLTNLLNDHDVLTECVAYLYAPDPWSGPDRRKG